MAYGQRKEIYNCARMIAPSDKSVKIMPTIILTRLKPEAMTITAEEQAGFRSGQSTVETDIQPENNLRQIYVTPTSPYNSNFDFKKACDSVDDHEKI